MPRSRLARASLALLPLAACATAPTFSYYSVVDGGDASVRPPDGSVAIEASPMDSSAVDGLVTGDDSTDDSGTASGAVDDAGGDGSELDGGCGPVDNVQNCGACGVACDLSHSDGAACALPDAGPAVCSYTSCSTGFSDCDAAPPNANGCETPITTLSNCGACGLSCNTTNSVDAGCGPTGCTYACAPNFANCNTTSAQGNAGGCACATPACCSTSGATPGAGGPGYTCETPHSNGIGQTYYDCEAVGSYTEAQALAACSAYVTYLGLSASACEYPATCPYVYQGTHYTAMYDAVYYQNASSDTGYVWVFDGTPGTTTGAVYAWSTFCTNLATRAAAATWN